VRRQGNKFLAGTVSVNKRLYLLCSAGPRAQWCANKGSRVCRRQDQGLRKWKRARGVHTDRGTACDLAKSWDSDTRASGREPNTRVQTWLTRSLTRRPAWSDHVPCLETRKLLDLSSRIPKKLAKGGDRTSNGQTTQAAPSGQARRKSKGATPD